MERFFAVLLEHYAGAFPPWLAPVQVVGIPVTDGHNEYLFDIADRLRERGVRVEVDTADDRMQKKIRNAQRAKVPYMLIAGDEDAAAGAVSFRYRDGTQKNGVPVAEAIDEIVAAIADREAKGHRIEFKFVGVEKAELAAAALRANSAQRSEEHTSELQSQSTSRMPSSA